MSMGFKNNKLAVKILLVFIALALVPTLLFGIRLINIAGGHMDRDVKVWEMLQPEYVEQARIFHNTLKTRLHSEMVSFALYSSFVATIIALIASGVILKPLRELMEGARNLGRGNLKYRLLVRGRDEISQLSSAFNAMADSVQAGNEDITRKNRELYALNTITAVTSHSMNLDDILKNTVQEALTIIGMDAGGIYLPDDEKQAITCACHINVPERFFKRMESFQFGEDIPGSVFVSGNTVAIADLASDPRSRDRAVRETGMKGYLCLPLKSKDKVQGILCMFSAHKHPFTSEELEFLESVSHILGVAIENIKLYERERSRLSGLVSLEKSRAEAILSSIAEGVYTTDRDRRITYWNKAAELITGHREENVVGKPCKDVLMHENEYGERLCGRHCIMKDDASKQIEGKTAFCTLAAGEKLPIAVTSAPIRDASGAEFGRVNVFRDITREKEIDRMKTDFVRTVSHELRTPLSAIVGMTEMLIDGEIKDQQPTRDYLETIHTEGQRLASMVQELLDIAKIESGRQELNKETVFVRPIIENCIRILSSYASSKRMTVNWEGPPSLPPIDADKGKIHQAFFNLLNNALCYSDNGATVNIHTRVTGDYLSIMFDDTGWGIPEQDLPHIFKKFYRSTPHARRVKGTGLGLPLVVEIIKSHNGKIEVESKLGLGSAFTVLLPLAKIA